MQITSINNWNPSKLKEDIFWFTEDSKEVKMHKIHAYPAKFPAFLIPKAISYAEKKNINVDVIGDVFCGCGTTALEARMANKSFYGYDINPVATLIAQVKSERYNKNILDKYYDRIKDNFSKTSSKEISNERIKYWFKEEQIHDLSKLLLTIKKSIPYGKYQKYFLCALSNILKPTSNWLTKSIKPQTDPDKIPQKVFDAFANQIKLMLKAVEGNKLNYNPQIKILRKNFLKIDPPLNSLDLLITSPPYVTSYEYADIHQLSSLWLGYTNDYKKLRTGSIGSLYHKKLIEKDFEVLNDTGKQIYKRMRSKDIRKAYSVAKYFLDINVAIEKTHLMLKEKGIAFFIVGNTSYKSIRIDNAKYLISCLLDNSFSNIEVFKRKITSKILTPYRDKKGKFSRNHKHRKVYQHEYIIIARKKNG